MGKLSFTWKRKLSALEITGRNIKQLFKDWEKTNPENKKLDLFKVAGTLSDFENVPTTYGDSVRLKGEFIAVNIESGEVFRANRLYLPDLMTEQLTAALSSLRSNDAQAVIEFGYLVSIIPDDKSSTGYVFTSESLLETNKVDPLAKLADTLGIKLALPAPTNDVPKAGEDETPATSNPPKGGRKKAA